MVADLPLAASIRPNIKLQFPAALAAAADVASAHLDSSFGGPLSVCLRYMFRIFSIDLLSSLKTPSISSTSLGVGIRVRAKRCSISPLIDLPPSAAARFSNSYRRSLQRN